MDQRCIEKYFPLNVFNKSFCLRNFSTLHKWWARTPLEISRSLIYLSLVSSGDEEIIKELINGLINEEPESISRANRNIVKSFKNHPKVLDPFAGGGSIPLESLRLGCESYANEYNPMAVLIAKCLLEYPQKYGSILSNDYIKWMDWVFREVKSDLGRFYSSKDDSTITAYIWARTIPCQNPSCGKIIPLMRQLWLVNKNNKKIALVPHTENGEVVFEIKKDDDIPEDFDPGKGTVNRAIANCLVCGSTVEAKKTRELFQEGKSGYKLVAVAYKKYGEINKNYRTPSKEDISLFEEAKDYLNIKMDEITNRLGFSPLPDEKIPKGRGIVSRALSVTNYGLEKWRDLFNPRQQLVMISFVDNIHSAYNEMLSEGLDEDYAKTLISYMALNIGRFNHVYSGLARWNPRAENVRDLFGRPAISLRWECGEINPFQEEMLYSKAIANSIIYASKIGDDSSKITFSSATSLPYNDNYFDAVFADPPYYDNIPYSFLSDFFYVWNKRILGHLYPDLFLTSLTPKRDEIISYSKSENDTSSFENKLKESFKEIYRVLKPEGILIVGYTFKTTDGWEMVVKSLLESGFSITASWPLVTMMQNRLRAHNAASISSSIFVVARKRFKEDIAWQKDIKNEINQNLPKKLENLLQNGITGSDFFIAGFGFGLGVYSKYKEILDNQGNQINLKNQFSYLQNFITDYLLESLLNQEISSSTSSLTKFYIIWRWNYLDSKVKFDDAQKLALSVGLDISKNKFKDLIIKKGSFVYLQGPDKRKFSNVDKSYEIIDLLHKVCILWKKGKTEEIKALINKLSSNVRVNLYEVANTIATTLPNNNKEKKLIEGFLLTNV